jgi:hypothetical protein
MIKKHNRKQNKSERLSLYAVVIAIARATRVQIIFTSAANLALSISWRRRRTMQVLCAAERRKLQRQDVFRAPA